MENVYIDTPQEVRNIIKTLCDNGYQAYAVGGCVRDSFLGREPEDWDITTSALPLEVKSMFKRTVDTGIKHGTVTIMIGSNGYEVTTYRIDGEYEDGRHPKSVEFSVSLLDDLKRRDFTINAMAYNSQSGLVDEFDGIGDLDRKIIKCVGNPVDRFSEDALRMMRAIRFSAQLDFEIEDKTFEAIKELAPTIKKVSKERIHVELNKTLMSDHPERIVLMCQTGLTKEILPVMDRILSQKRFPAVLVMLKNTEKELVLRYAALLAEATPEEVTEMLRSLKLDNYTIETTAKIVKCAKVSVKATEPDVREAIHQYGKEFIPLIIKHTEATIAAKEESTGIMLHNSKKHIVAIKRLYKEITERGDCISIKDLDINGSDLIEYGMQGARIGQTLEELLHIVMENPKLNNKATLIALIENR